MVRNEPGSRRSHDIRRSGFEREGEHFINGRHQVHDEAFAQFRREVFVHVLRVLARKDHFVDPEAARGEHFFLDPTDGQHAA